MNNEQSRDFEGINKNVILIIIKGQQRWIYILKWRETLYFIKSTLYALRAITE